MCVRDVREWHWISSVLSLSRRIIIIQWSIVMHSLCERYFLLQGRTFVLSMCVRDVREWHWISSVLSLSRRIIIVQWSIVMYSLRARCFLLQGRIFVQ